jgi:hypothetical protein
MASEDVQVLVEDQQRINRFSRLNIRIKELDTEIELMKVYNKIPFQIQPFRRDCKPAVMLSRKPKYALTQTG